VLILSKQKKVQAIERIGNNDNWITILLVILIFTVFLLKAIDSKKLKSYAFNMFYIGSLKGEVDEDKRFFNTFQSVISLFLILVFSLLLYKLRVYFSPYSPQGFSSFCILSVGVFIYFISKWFLEYLLSLLFKIKATIRHFLVSKFSYLCSASFILFFAIIFVEYSKVSIPFLLYFSIALILLRGILFFLNNKKLIFSELFYFILYLCAFEIAPLFILFKLLF